MYSFCLIWHSERVFVSWPETTRCTKGTFCKFFYFVLTWISPTISLPSTLTFKKLQARVLLSHRCKQQQKTKDVYHAFHERIELIMWWEWSKYRKMNWNAFSVKPGQDGWHNASKMLRFIFFFWVYQGCFQQFFMLNLISKTKNHFWPSCCKPIERVCIKNNYELYNKLRTLQLLEAFTQQNSV